MGDTGRPRRRALAHLDEELDEGLFVLLLQPVQGHRQRHGRLGWAPRTAAAAVAVTPGLLWLRVPAALARWLAGSLAHSLDSPGVKLPAASDPQHRLTPRARLEGVAVPATSNRWAGPGGRGVGGAAARRLWTLQGKWAGRTAMGVASGKEGGEEREGTRRGRRGCGGSALASGDPPLRSQGDAARRGLGWAARIGGAVPASHAPQRAGGKGPGSRSLTPPPSVARPRPPQLLLGGCQVTSCGGSSGPLPRCSRGTHHHPRP